jgi:hypothetical protein
LSWPFFIQFDWRMQIATDRHGPCDVVGAEDQIVPPRDKKAYQMQIIANLRSPSALPARPEMGLRPNDEPAESAGVAHPGRSIVAIHSGVRDAEKPARHARPTAVFLAHLIATAQQAPQTRQRRRAESNDAIAHYVCATPRETSSGRKLRSLI